MKTHLGVGKTESAMKKFMTVLSVVLMAAGFVSCKKEINVYGPAPEKGELKVRFIADASLTKVGLTPDENDENFSAVWDKDDYIGIVCTDKNDSKVTDDEILACWVPSADTPTPGYFETSLDATSLTEGNAPYSFVGYWPQGIAVANLFPSSRMQNGDKYNGNYDIMISDKTAVDFSVTENNAVTVVLPMKRQTSIAYFHIKSELNEKIVSATLTTGEGEFIAASNANLSGDGFSIVDGCGENSITLLIEGDMYSSDFKLWFNVLPVDYTSMKLVVETDTHSFTMSKKAPGSWKAGELNSVVIENVPADKWAVKETPSEPVEKTLSIADYASANKWENATQYLSIDIDENLTVKCAGKSNTGKYYSNGKTWRMYQNENAKVTFTLSDGYKFQDAKITYKVDNTGILVYDGTNVSSDTSLNVTDKTSFEFGVGNSGKATNGNIQIISIYVKYIKSGSGSFDPANPNYAISVVGNIVGGTVTPSRSYAKETEKFTVTCEPSIGYEYVSESLVVKNAVTGENLVADNNGEYTMPAANVTVTASFSAKPQYSIAVQTPVGGTLTADKESAWEGAEVNVNATAAEKYAFKEWNVTWGDKGETVSVVDNKFAMPAGNVNVSATFIPTLTVTPMNQTINSSAGEYSFTVETVATDWTVSAPEEDTWVSITKNESDFVIAYTANELETETTLERSTTITVSSEQAEKTGDNAIKIKFSQSGKKYIKPDVSYNLVQSVDELYEGMVFVIGCGTKNVAAGAMGDNAYLSKVDANITEGVLSSNSALEFTLGKSGDNWTLTSSEGVLGANAEKKLLKNAGTTTWNISIDEFYNASITSTDSSCGTILYNSNSGSTRFLNYTSKQTAVQIYALENREAQSISYSGNTGSIDIYTNEQNLPTLDQSGVKTSVKYDSSDETVATIDKNGTITALKAGTTTITATAVASDSYKPASTSFTLTVTDSTPYLTAKASKTSVAATGETVTITVDTNVEGWTAISDNSAFVVGKPSGNTVDVVVSENKDASERTATITVTAGTLFKTIKLTQMPAGTKVQKTATITFGTNKVRINNVSVTANDSCSNSWTITTVGTTSFNPQPTFSQVGSKDSPANSITFTTTLPSDAEVGSIEAKFGGFNGTAGTVSLKVGDTSVGSGSLNAGNDVTVSSTSTAKGNVVTVSVTGISKGVKCYHIKVGYKTAN